MYENLWGSIVAFANDVIDDRKPIHPNAKIRYVDWEAHANIQELPEADLIGTTAITFTEDEPEMFHGSFTIGVSTYGNDHHLFRLRNYVGEVFKRLRPTSKIGFYDHQTLEQKGWLHIVDGTIVMPMTRADVRPLQFIQCQFIFDPVTGAG
ncbi:hypothetical protein ACCS91_33425 [Rhizobium ruizarguesonis]|uniref:hypothetical protein n=1 Tax=Rhizobium ruizarguesonis TaxID=2081791 RepID=UPI001639C9DF|nr:hypothetical protein [Rhizobium ruizarguesonis]MBC2806551.1 hypothetical protein [Rhizobium ruizarguesonis]